MKDDESPKTESMEKDYQDLLRKVEDRHKHLMDKWGKDAEKIWSMYAGDETSLRFNILYSNTETFVPAVFSRKPIPKVKRRHDEQRADIPAEVTNRMLSFLMDTNLPEYPDFMTAIGDSVLDAAIAGQGLYRVRLVQQLPVLDLVEWNKYAWGFCTRWESKPWEAFAHDMTPGEILEMFPELSDEQKKTFEAKATERLDASSEQTPDGEKKPETIRVWEVWVKKDRMRHFLCDCADNCCLASEPDPLRLQGFFSTPPQPLTFIHSTISTMPRPLYRLYQQQAEELNEISHRLYKVVKALKVRGVYASGLDDIPRVFNEDDDNTFIPSTGAAQIVTTGKGLEAYIWMLPIDKLVLVARELYQAREAVKSTIYEILGIGDILRGVSKASETLGAQQLKDKWGTLRINKARERTSDFIRAGLRLLTEVAVEHMPSQLWSEVTGVKLQPEQQTAIMMQQAQANGQQAQIDPMKTWAGVLGVLKSDLQRAYTIDIEVNSSVDSEATEEKAEMAEFMNALGQAMAGLKELMTSSPQGWEAGKAILVGVCAKFELGTEVEPILRGLPPPAALNGPPPEVQKMMQDVQKRAQDLAKREEGVKQDEAALQDMMNSVKEMQQAVEAQKEALRNDQRNALREVDYALKDAQITLREEAMAAKMAKQEANMAGKQAVQQAGMAKDRATHAAQMGASKITQAAQSGAAKISQARRAAKKPAGES